MRVRLIGTLIAALAIGLPAVGAAQAALDAPHDTSFNDGGCNKCHGLFQRTSSGKADYNPGCTGCHNGALPTTSFGLPWPDDATSPGKGGQNHSWTKPVVNDEVGAKAPGSTNVDKFLLDGGRLQCIVCHNLHAPKTASDPASMHTSFAIDAPRARTGSTNPVPGSATLTLKAAGSNPKGYRIRIESVTGGGGTFSISHDFGVPPGTYSAPYAFTNNVTRALDDATVSIQISANSAVGDYWDFYISHPMLRLSNIDDAGCVICHAERSMNHVRARGADSTYLPNGARRFSHPVGVGLNANAHGWDRTVVRDANGDPQGTDAYKTNDLLLDAGVVRCTTCHAVHNADSNSLTEDAR